MATLSQYTFVPRPINGDQVGASQTEPQGDDGYRYWEVVECAQGAAPASVTNISANLNSYQSGGGAGKRVGFIAYDFANARWSFISLKSFVFVNNGWLNDKGAIQDFCNSLAAPTTVDEAGNSYTVPAAVAPIHG